MSVHTSVYHCGRHIAWYSSKSFCINFFPCPLVAFPFHTKGYFLSIPFTALNPANETCPFSFFWGQHPQLLPSFPVDLMLGWEPFWLQLFLFFFLDLSFILLVICKPKYCHIFQPGMNPSHYQFFSSYICSCCEVPLLCFSTAVSAYMHGASLVYVRACVRVRCFKFVPIIIQCS